jgi:4-amino-4-deoxychorismate lyase
VIQGKDISAQRSLVKSEFFETIKIEDGIIFYLEYHQRRYESVLRAHGIEKFQNLSEFIQAPQKGLYRCKLIYNCSDTQIETLYFPYTPAMVTTLKLVYDDRIEYAYKSLDRSALENLFDQREMCDDILIVKNGLLTDTSKANIALFKDGKWWTPKTPLLAGTTRQRLLEEKKIFEADIEVDSIQNFEKLSFMNAMIGFQTQDRCEILL